VGQGTDSICLLVSSFVSIREPSFSGALPFDLFAAVTTDYHKSTCATSECYRLVWGAIFAGSNHALEFPTELDELLFRKWPNGRTHMPSLVSSVAKIPFLRRH